MGLYASAKEYVGWPITPGFEVSGVVAAVGAGVHRFAEGDLVFGVTRFGGYATHVVLPEHQLYAKPAKLSHAQAASLPAVFLTAYYALFELAAARAGDDILVHSAAGGVGSLLLQLARIAKVRAVGVVGRPEKVQTALDMGAAHVIDKSHEDLWARARALSPSGYASVFDANGVETLQQSFEHLARPGRLVIYGFHTMMQKGRGKPNWPKLALDWLRTPRFNPLDLTNKNASIMAFNLSYMFENHALLARSVNQLLAWIESGELVAPPISLFPFERVADAHRAIESGNTVGKLVLEP
jgi:NADPH:quinone reductase-like Zn-dependent oxidoreductase